jgi:translation initiation factor IF-1
MAQEEKIEVEGEVVEALPIKVEFSTYDLSRGRITYRQR